MGYVIKLKKAFWKKTKGGYGSRGGVMKTMGGKPAIFNTKADAKESIRRTTKRTPKYRKAFMIKKV